MQISLSSIRRRELWSLANASGGKPRNGTRSRWAGVFTLGEMRQGMQRMLLLEADSVRKNGGTTDQPNPDSSCAKLDWTRLPSRCRDDAPMRDKEFSH